jgi:hypothetical protein
MCSVFLSPLWLVEFALDQIHQIGKKLFEIFKTETFARLKIFQRCTPLAGATP